MGKVLSGIWTIIVAVLLALIPLFYRKGQKEERVAQERKELDGQTIFYKRMAEESIKAGADRGSLSLPDKLRKRGL